MNKDTIAQRVVARRKKKDISKVKYVSDDGKRARVMAVCVSDLQTLGVNTGDLSGPLAWYRDYLGKECIFIARPFYHVSDEGSPQYDEDKRKKLELKKEFLMELGLPYDEESAKRFKFFTFAYVPLEYYEDFYNR